MIARLLSWWRRDDHMARRAWDETLRQEMELHPVEKGEHRDRDLPVVPASGRARMQDVWPAGVSATRDRVSYKAAWPPAGDGAEGQGLLGDV